MTAQLILVATPIGNLGDMSHRAIETLRSADVIACEDTRHSRKLLNYFQIHNVPLISLHQHNEIAVTSEIIERIQNQQMVALITDAGMPAISDPGEKLVAAVANAGLRVSVIPGPSAAIAALAISGLPSERFCFEGFLPRKGSSRRVHLQALKQEERTSVIYEAPHRIVATVLDLTDYCGTDRQVVLVRELTKIHEEVWRGTLSELTDHLGQYQIKGECVLVLAGAVAMKTEVDDSVIKRALQHAISDGMSHKDAVELVSSNLNLSKRRVYQIAIRE